MGWRDLILEIQAQGEDGKWEVGTGFPVGVGLILTARHVLFTEKNLKRNAILARWEGYAKGDFDDEVQANWSKGYSEYLHGELLWDDREFDLALLKVQHPRSAQHINLSNQAISRCETRQSRGFPNGAKVGENSEGINIRGSLYPPTRDQPRAQFDPIDPPPALGDWSGMSGAPLIDEKYNCVDAVVLIAREALGAARVLKVVCVKDILEAVGFRAQLLKGLSGGHSPSPEQVQERLRTHQSACRYRCEMNLDSLLANRRVMRRLADLLALDQSLADQPEEFLDKCLEKLLADPQRGLNVLGGLEADNRGKESHKPLCALIQNLALLLLNDVEASVLMLGDTVGAMIELAPGNPTGLEVRAAQIDGRPLNLQERRRADAEIPAGRFALNIVSAEVGPHKSITAGPSEHDLLARSGMRALGHRETVEQFMIKKLPLLDGVRRSPLSDGDKADLKTAFQLRRARNETSYLAHVLNLPPELQEQADQLVAYFRETYPDVRIIPIDVRKWDADVSRFAAVINTIPVVPDDQI